MVISTFFRFTLGYFVFAVCLVFITRDEPTEALFNVVAVAFNLMPVLVRYGAYLFFAALIIGVLCGQKRTWTRLVTDASAAFMGTVVFHSSFGLIKTSLPYIIPFWADPMFAQLDAALHFGTDPWVIAYAISEYLPMEMVLPVYMKWWALPAAGFPMLLATMDQDFVRVKRYLILFVVAWCFVGNIVALAFLSVGPVFYDLLLETERFTALMSALASSPIQDTRIPYIQQGLWQVYIEDGQNLGSGISAFPSVHVSVAALTCLYLVERSRWLAPLGLVFLLSVLFLSVYTGYHYAVDGYASILIILGFNWFLKRRESLKV